MQYREKGIPKDKCCRCKIDDKEAVLHFDKRRRKVTIKHDPKMLIPVLNINPGIKNFQSFNVAFSNVIQNEGLSNDKLIDFDLESDWEGIEGMVLRTIDSETHLNKHVDAAELISKNENIENKLFKI